MIARWNRHPYAAVVIVIVVLIGLTFARFRHLISVGELFSLLLEVAIVVMIFSELGDGAAQIAILDFSLFWPPDD